MLPFYTDQQIAAALDIDALINAMEAGLTAFSSGRVLQPARMRIHDPPGCIFWPMPAAATAFSLKKVTHHPRNLLVENPARNSLIIVCDQATGMPIALLEGNYLTQMRTSTVSAVAAHHLPNLTPRYSQYWAVAQAREHVTTMRRIREF